MDRLFKERGGKRNTNSARSKGSTDSSRSTRSERSNRSVKKEEHRELGGEDRCRKYRVKIPGKHGKNLYFEFEVYDGEPGTSGINGNNLLTQILKIYHPSNIHTITSIVNFNPPFVVPPVVTFSLAELVNVVVRNPISVINNIPTINNVHINVSLDEFETLDSIIDGNDDTKEIFNAAVITEAATIGVAYTIKNSEDVYLYFSLSNGYGNTWSPPSIVDNTPTLKVAGVDMIRIGDDFAIVYYDVFVDRLYFISGSPGNWNPRVIVNHVAPVTSGGQFPQIIQLAEDRLGICFYAPNVVPGALVWAYCSDNTGTAWTLLPVLELTTDDHGRYCSLSILPNGLPFICYVNTTTNTINIVTAKDVWGTAWNAPVIIDNVPVNTISASTINGIPVIMYYDTLHKQLRYRIGDASGNIWGNVIIIYAGNIINPVLSLLSNGLPCVVFMLNEVGGAKGPKVPNEANGVHGASEVNGDLIISVSEDFGGVLWFTPRVLINDDVTNMIISLVPSPHDTEVGIVYGRMEEVVHKLKFFNQSLGSIYHIHLHAQ